MDRLNYHHLFLFWVVAREGGLVAAGKVLRLSHPTLSAQVHALEESLGAQLFAREGRRLVPTETGRMALRYADEIFTLGRELQDAVQGRSNDKPLRLEVGVVDALPKMVVRRLLQPALSMAQPVRLVCHEGSYPQLMADLSMHALDLVLSDAPVAPGSSVRAYGHLLAETDVSLYGTRPLVDRYASQFPRGLDGAPLLWPMEGLPLRRALDAWLRRHELHPRIVAEFDDSALMKSFGADGAGLFPAPSNVSSALRRQYGVELLGRLPEVSERFYAITGERRLSHPAVVAIEEAARAARDGRRDGDS